MIVKNISLLKAMKKAGLIEFHEQTGTKIRGLYGGKPFTCYYVWDALRSQFEYNGVKYQLKYFDGCFMPFVVEVELN